MDGRTTKITCVGAEEEAVRKKRERYIRDSKRVEGQSGEERCGGISPEGLAACGKMSGETYGEADMSPSELGDQF